MMETQERIRFLRHVGILDSISDDVLVQVAAALELLFVKAGEAIFAKGDRGDAMYIITEGQVSIDDDHLHLNNLNTGGVFGEMAVLDTEMRSASATAVVDTHLFRLSRSHLNQLMSSEDEVTRGIIQVLCNNLRARGRDLVEELEYMRQFAKVTAAAQALEAGLYTPESLDEVTRRGDALGQLAQVFQRMASEVIGREKRLQHEVQKLRIDVDLARQTRQVAEITESDFFRQLEQKIQELRH